jgi:ABC-type cobalamin transport system permease subunit
MSFIQSFAVIAACGIAGLLVAHRGAGTFVGLVLSQLLRSHDARGARRR